ncbi:MAG: helix-turn-helix transcriptional regulator [Clostridia bacterium]|nr:helix-turn-helix transcriptional regulator [Clostridia bacterium]
MGVRKLNIVGNKIQQYRKKLNLSRQDLSNILMVLGYDISANSLYNIEIGVRTVVDYEICAIARAF